MKWIFWLVFVTTSFNLNAQVLGAKFDTKNHPKAKGVWATVRYPSEWQSKEGERPNIVQKFSGYYQDLFVMLAIQILDIGGPVEKECRDTSAAQFGRDMSEGENQTITTIRKGSHENKPAYFYDLESKVERAGMAATTTRSRVMTVCYKNTLVSAWCSPAKIDEAKQTLFTTQQHLTDVNSLCFQFFNSLVLMGNYEIK
jgi:hypothetical protein